jgi:hypothetical protein
MSTPDDAVQSMIRNLESKTGRTLADWVRIAKESGLGKHGEVVKMLKSDHGLTHGYANLIAIRSRESDAPSDPVDAQYAGGKAGLRPIYDRIVGEVESFGNDVEVAPKKTYVSLRRRKQFAIVQPSTASRLDLGLNLKGTEPTGRLEPSGSFNSMVSHRIRLEAPDDVDDQVLGWLRAAYDAA